MMEAAMIGLWITYQINEVISGFLRGYRRARGRGNGR